MKKFIGLDVHSASFTMVVMKEDGRVERCCQKPTGEEPLIDAVSQVVGERHLILEESHMAQWSKAVLDPHVDRLVISDPVYNRWIAKDDFADDRTSATKLAELLRIGNIREVYHPGDSELAELRRLFCHYYHTNRQLTQCKNRLKATFRQVAVPTKGAGIYKADDRTVWLDKVKAYPSLQMQAVQLYGLLDSLDVCKAKTKRAMVKLARRQPGFELLTTFPGVAEVLASGYIAILITPHRFSRRNKLWRYASLGNVRHVSDGVVYRKGHSRTGSRALKWLVTRQFQAAVLRPKTSHKTNRFRRKYLRLVASGVSQAVARRQVCRNILSSIRAAWTKGEAYRDELIITAQ